MMEFGSFFGAGHSCIRKGHIPKAILSPPWLNRIWKRNDHETSPANQEAIAYFRTRIAGLDQCTTWANHPEVCRIQKHGPWGRRLVSLGHPCEWLDERLMNGRDSAVSLGGCNQCVMDGTTAHQHACWDKYLPADRRRAHSCTVVSCNFQDGR